MVALTQRGQELDGLAQALPALLWVRAVLEEVLADAHQLEREQGGEVIADGPAISMGGEILGEFGEALDLVTGFLVPKPLEVATLFPLGEILLADGVARELLGQDGLGVGKAIEPIDELCPGLTVFEAAVELEADLFGEPGDFTVTSHGRLRDEG